MPKKSLLIKFEGTKPLDNVVKASIPATDTSHITGQKIVFNHRYLAHIDTGLKIVAPKGYKVCFALTAELTAKGMIAPNAPGNVTDGPLVVTLLNCGREIVEVKNGDPIAVISVEEDLDFEWSE